MHQFTLVLVPADTQDILRQVTDLLAPYDEKVDEVFERSYIEGEELERLAEYAGFSMEDLPHLANYVLEWTRVSFGRVDDKGLFYVRKGGCWDYWKIGGRWDGVVQGKSRNTKGRSNYGPEHEQLQCNICAVKELPKNLFAWVIVTPDGEWHEGEWWKTPFGEKQMATEQAQRWRKIMWELLEHYADCIAVGIDKSS